MRVELRFYHYKHLRPFLSPWSLFRLWFHAKVTEYVHCNVSVDGQVYELASWGGHLFKEGEYPFPASLIVPLEVSEKDFFAFVRTFRAAAVRRCPALCHILALALPQLDNCASVTKSMVGYRASTPDRLLKGLRERGNAEHAY